MKTFNPGSMSLLLMSCVLSTSVSLPVLAAGNGEIVLERTVQGHMAGRNPGVDPYPTTVNANPSAMVVRTTSNELGDNDFAGVSSGAGITRVILPGGNLPGLGNAGGGAGLGAGSSAGHGAGNGSGLSGTINGSISRGLAPLNNIGSMMGGK